jgi:hypothetical protein
MSLGAFLSDLHHACHAQKLIGHPKDDLLSSLIEHACQNVLLCTAALQERCVAVDGERLRAEAELALSNSALAACKRQLSNARAENVSLVGAFEQTMQGQGELGCGTAPSLLD